MTNPLPSRFEHVLQATANADVTTLVKKDAEYGSSWKKRGGVGAFMMLARKWDRLETQVNDPSLDNKWDVFDAIEHLNPASGESVLETIRDLRRYLLLVESEIELRKQVSRGGTTAGVVIKQNIGTAADPKYAVVIDTEDRIPERGGQTAKYGDS